MRYFQINEGKVKSSWIYSLDYDDETNTVLMTLNSGNEYEVSNVPYLVFRQWIRARSKGKYWHRRIRGNYVVERV